jgi:predicted CoA-binding protein
VFVHSISCAANESEILMAKPTIAIVGASSDPSKFGNKAVKAYLQRGFEVFPVNPKGGEIEGLTVYTTLAEVPVEHLDRISVYLPPAVGVKMLDDIAAKPHDELWLNPGSDSDEVVARAHQLELEPIVACSIVDIGISPHDV